MRKLFNSYRSKVILLTLIVVFGSQTAYMAAVLFVMNRDVAQRADASLQSGRAAFRQLIDARSELLEQNVRLLAEKAEFRAALGSNDADRLQTALTDAAGQAGASLGMLLRLDGSVVASTDGLDLAAVDFERVLRQPRSTLIMNQRAFELITVPVRSGSAAGWVAMGYPVDESLAGRIAGITGLETTFLAEGRDGRVRLVGSSLPVERREPLINIVLRIASASQVDAIRDTKPAHVHRQIMDDFNSSFAWYLPGDQRIAVVVQQPLAQAMAPYQTLQGTMFHALATTVFCALLMALYMSRSILQPIRALSLAARRLRVGNYDRRLEIKTNNEFTDLAEAFDAMREGIAEREQRIIYQARHDTLTGLPNRLQAMELLRDALRKGSRESHPVAVMIMHLQRFREIQSSLGHEIGDEVLRQSAQRLRENLPENHVLARLEGDQFLVIAPDTHREAAQQLAQELARHLDTGLNVQSVNVTLDVRMGICICPEHGRQPDELLRRAAVAKNDAQQQHDRIRIYQNGREARHVRQLAILGDLRNAAREDQFKLYLQPKITLHDTQVCGAEALLRWEHPELGKINPKEFIPLAESAGSISMITEWVLCRAISEARKWKDQGIDLPIAVNLSGRDLHNAALPKLIVHELEEHGMDPGCLIVEVTEEAVVHDIDYAVETLSQLRAMGVRTSMDDFGTGYSSLAHLQRLPMDELKIDRAFVSHLPDQQHNAAIVRSVIDLAHSLGLEVVAEGVETTAALRWLREQGCERAQGYYLSKPLPADRFVGWVRNWEQLAGDMQNERNPGDSLILRPRLIRR